MLKVLLELTDDLRRLIGIRYVDTCELRISTPHKNTVCYRAFSWRGFEMFRLTLRHDHVFSWNKQLRIYVVTNKHMGWQ
jgi:hypothetical protein